MKNELVLIGLYITTFGLGYVFGRLSDKIAAPNVQPTSFLKMANKTTTPAPRVEIDEAKYVAPIDTAGLTRGNATNSIGKTTATKDDIQGSVSKLAQLKGK